MELKEKRITVEINGRKVRCFAHMVEDMERLGAKRVKTTIKNPPPELVMGQSPRKIILPDRKPETVEVKSTVLPEMKTLGKMPETTPIKTRKTPVRSKSKK